MASGICECGCGGITTIAKWSSAPRGDVKGQPHRFVVGHRPKPVLSKRYEVDEAGCWIWTGALTHEGYGRLAINYRETTAHRGVWQQLTGITLPRELEVDHVCRVRACVNPDHLEIVTRSTNERRKRNPDLPEIDPRCIEINRAAGRTLARIEAAR